MSSMTKHERVAAALAGEPVDRVPASIWFHFDKDHVAGRAMADAHIAHVNRYDLDYLKVMNDNPYDMPADLPVIRNVDDWTRLESLPADAPGFVAQCEGLRILRRELGELFMTTTIFNPFASASKLCGKMLLDHIKQDREKVRAGMEVVTRSLCTLAKECIRAGAEGVFLACSGAAEEELSEADYRELIRDLDIQVLKAAGAGRFNLIHVHGNGCPFDVFAGYPGHAINWSSTRNAPDLKTAKDLTSMCLVGGWDQEGPVAGGDLDGVRRETAQALAATGGGHFMLGPGCTIPSDTPEEHIHAAIDSGRTQG